VGIGNLTGFEAFGIGANGLRRNRQNRQRKSRGESGDKKLPEIRSGRNFRA
jgi:hypothetical protein